MTTNTTRHDIDRPSRSGSPSPTSTAETTVADHVWARLGDESGVEDSLHRS